MMYQGLYQEVHHLKIRRNPVRDLSKPKLKASNYVCDPGQGSITLAEFLTVVTPAFKGILIDVREPEEYYQGSIPGSENFPLLNLDNHVSKIVPVTSIILFCKSGARSRQGYELIRTKYPEQEVQWLIGGIVEYNRSIL